MRMEPDLRDWLTRHASERGLKDAQVVRELLVALRAGRLTILAPGPHPFPAEVTEHPGGSSDYPILIAYPENTRG